MGWLEQHIEEFVKPVVHTWPDPPLTADTSVFTQEELTVIKNAWRSVKRSARGRTVLLPGRDVFIFEILARRENYPTVFIPECSRMTVSYIADHLDEFLPDGIKLDKCFLFDTGFAGSIPRALGMVNKSNKRQEYQLLSFAGLSNNAGVQTFPRLTWSRGLALKIEQTPKYWESGRLVGGTGTGSTASIFFLSTNTSASNANGCGTVTTQSSYANPVKKVSQPRSNLAEFIRAARLTIAIYKNSAPKFINRHKPLIPEGGLFTKW